MPQTLTLTIPDGSTTSISAGTTASPATVLTPGQSIPDGIAKAVAAGGGRVELGPGHFDLPGTTTVIPNGVDFTGRGAPTTLTYAGVGSALRIEHGDQGVVGGFNLFTTQDSANGIEIGTVTRAYRLERINLVGTNTLTNTGSGVLLKANATDGDYSGGLCAENVYPVGYKYGYNFVGADRSVNTWTAVTFLNCWQAGRSAGYIPGGAGVRMDANSNCGGVVWTGGLIEANDTAILHENGGTGGHFSAAIEGYNTLYSVGASFMGSVNVTHGAQRFSQVGQWFSHSVMGGANPTTTSYYAPWIIVKSDSTVADELKIFRGDVQMFGLGMGMPGDMNPNRTYVRIGNNKVTFGRPLPTTGVSAGDFNSDASGLSVCSSINPLTWRKVALV